MGRGVCYNFEDALKLITADDSYISDFSDDDSDTDIENLRQDGMVQDQENDSPDKDEDEEIEVECSVNAKHVYHWRKGDVPTFNDEFKGKFSDAPKNLTPYEYFKYFLLKILVN